MYCAFDDDNNVIAFHDKKRPVEIYIDRVYLCNKLILKMGKIKKENRHLKKAFFFLSFVLISQLIHQ